MTALVFLLLKCRLIFGGIACTALPLLPPVRQNNRHLHEKATVQFSLSSLKATKSADIQL